LYVATDHSYLVNILGEQSLPDIENPRLARLKERTLWWRFKILHTPDKKQLAADAISRRNKLPAVMYKVSVMELADDEEEFAWNDIVVLLKSVKSKVKAVMKSDNIKVITSDNLYEATQEDTVIVLLVEMVYRGFPQCSYDVDEDLKPYYQFRHDLHVVGGVVCYKDRVIIPAALRHQV
jgi:hypothetical protein